MSCTTHHACDCITSLVETQTELIAAQKANLDDQDAELALYRKLEEAVEKRWSLEKPMDDLRNWRDQQGAGE